VAQVSSFLTVLLGLGLPGFLPALAVAGRSPVLVFLAPLTGGILLAVATELELGVGGSLLECYVLVAAVVNLAVIGWWLVSSRPGSPAPQPAGRPATTGLAGAGPAETGLLAEPGPAGRVWAWQAATVAGILAGLALPLVALRSYTIGWDSNSIWLTHALMIYGGHHELLTSLQNHAYTFSNPDYPPLVPAAEALAFKFYGVNLLLGVRAITFLTACAVAIAGTGIATSGLACAGAATGRRRASRPLVRVAAIIAGGAFCVAGFSVAAKYGIDGHADLMWGASAVAAIIWGLVLPRSRQSLLVAWVCVVAASLTKNEGLVTALILLVLIAFRYRPLRRTGWLQLSDWAGRSLFVAVPALPGLAWAGIARLIGLRDAFFTAPSGQSVASRATATIAAMAGQLKIVGVAALVVLAAGSWALRRRRERAWLGNPAWLWSACLASLATLFLTYVIGSDPIAWWLTNSVNRTTIFAQVLLYGDMAVWLVLAISALAAPEESRAAGATRPAATGTATAKLTAGLSQPPV
jgi:hypothetical protein